ncbi:MAG: hypothetical protein V7609_3382 [Verrucomicrobiota bacterium]
MAKDRWEKADIVGKLTGSVLIPLGLAIGSYLFNAALQERAARQKTVELAITVLQSEKTDRSPKLQEWALGVLKQTTEAASQTLPPQVLDELKKEPLPSAQTVAAAPTRIVFKQVDNGLIANESFRSYIDWDGIDGRKLDPESGQDMTSLKYPDGKSLDSRQVPYLALPFTNVREEKIQTGDYAVLFNVGKGTKAFAVVGDQGPAKNSLGISPALATPLGVKFQKRGDITSADKLILLVFPSSADGKWPDSLDQQAAALFAAWGGEGKMQPYIQPRKP